MGVGVDRMRQRARYQDAVVPSGSGFVWCSSCERAYREGELCWDSEFETCPYAGCSGDAVVDAWDWARVRAYHSEYPEEPELGRVYPIYHDGACDAAAEDPEGGQGDSVKQSSASHSPSVR